MQSEQSETWELAASIVLQIWGYISIIDQYGIKRKILRTLSPYTLGRVAELAYAQR